LPGTREVDLPDEVRRAEARDDERRNEPKGPIPHVLSDFSIGRAEAYVLGPGRLSESRVECKPVHVDPVQEPAELGLAVAHVRAHLDHTRAVDAQPQPRRAQAFLDPERLSRTLRERRCNSCAE